MSFLETLTDNQRHILVSLPYRAGLWVSQSDKSGGGDSDARELQVLDNIISGFAADMFGSETVQLIMMETVRRKEQWPAWAKQVSSVLEDSRFALDVIAQYADAKDVAAFRNHLMEIGEAVALAFREYDSLGVGAKVALYIDFLRSRLKKPPPGQNVRYKTLHEFFNISPSERRALGTLADALGTVYI